MRGVSGIVVASASRWVSLSVFAVLVLPLATMTGCGTKSGKPADAAVCADGGCDAACVDGCDAACASGDCCTRDDQCAAGSYCDPLAGHCLPGCRDDQSCVAVRPADGGDGGLDGGLLGDGGVRSATPYCEPQSHLCVACLGDDQCGLGELCRGYHCAAGCSDDHGCAEGQSCCDGACVDLDDNKVNCGACGTVCTGISQCCGGVCTDVYGSDTRNCGLCGMSCGGGPHAFPACNQGDCVIGSCSTGYADCNHRVSDGCEVNTGSDVNNCGGCGQTCAAKAHSTPRCVGGYCDLDCASGYADCNGQLDDGCEVDVRSDFAHCGSCGTACPTVAHSTFACESALCVLSGCDTGWVDCDGDPTNGCEVNTVGDVKNCGTCGLICPSVPNSAPACNDGVCGATGCGGKWLDCNANSGDGCETDISNDAANCGACHTYCPAPANGVAACADSTCGIGSCNPGFGDCNKDSDDGCEANLSTDPMNCGVCAKTCMLAHALTSCQGSACHLDQCAAGWGDCDNNATNGCEADLGSLTSCGRCGNACATRANTTATTCTSGSCGFVCAADYADCDRAAGNGCETNIKLSVSNCGACGNACAARAHSSVSCSSGACSYACSPGWHDCDGNPANGCESDYNDVANCGGCGMSCAARPHTTVTCASAACSYTCVAGWGDCDGNAGNGCETDLQADVNHCGACPHACSANANQVPACQSGSCVLACAPGFADCDGVSFNGCEKSIDADPASCGGCGKVCQPVAHALTVGCSSSACTISTCSSGYQDCDGSYANGCEAHPIDDVQNCGACSNACPVPSHAAAACSGGACGMGACASGWADCDGSAGNGCEQNVATDVNHCGACDTVCGAVPHGTPGCSSGGCVVAACASGWANCNGSYGDGCESQLASDANNCGSCGRACSYAHGVGVCTGGTCALAGCSTGYASCDGNDANGCEIDTQTDANHCGACGVTCGTGEYCVLGSCRQSQVKLLLLHAETGAGYLSDVQNKLQATGGFSTIGTYDAHAGTPALATLQAYDVVLVWSHDTFYNPTALGNVLANYYDGGGRVVVALFALGQTSSGYLLGGKFGTASNGYILIQPTASYRSTASSLGTVAEPASPLMQGVSQLSATYGYRSAGGVVNGGTTVASWSTGEPMVVRGSVQGRQRVDLNLWPVSSDGFAQSWTGDGTRILLNALLYK